MASRTAKAAQRRAAPRSSAVRGATPAAAEPPVVRSTNRAIRRYGSVYAAAAAGVVATGFAFVFLRHIFVEIGAIAFFFTYLASMLARLPRLTHAKLRAHADESDIPGYIIIVVALATVVTASVSLFMLLNGAAPDRFRMALGLIAVTLGWLTIHAMLAFHYAYEYYETDQAGPMGTDGRKAHVGGLDFPGREAPDALSFLYFSFVVAMTAQVSDVTVTTNRMRRLVLLHGILSFVFNTVIIAVAVNVVVSLGR